MKKILVTILTELEYLRKVQSASIASEKLGGNLVKEEWSKGCATGLLMAKNVVVKIAQNNIEDSKNGTPEAVQQTQLSIVRRIGLLLDEWDEYKADKKSVLEDILVFMLDDDINTVDDILCDYTLQPSIVSAWNRIKKELVEIKKPASNKQSAPCKCWHKSTKTYTDVAIICDTCGAFWR